LILYLNFRGIAQTLIVLTAVPFAAVGAIWLLYAVGFNTSLAVWVGMIALLGVAAETASVMVVYLDEAWKEGTNNGSMVSVDALIAAATEAGSKRVRPLLMTVMTNILGLLPVLLVVVPAVYVVWRSYALRKGRANAGAPVALA